jgi:hypothetical protein
MNDELLQSKAALIQAQQEIAEIKQQKLQLDQYERFSHPAGGWAYRLKGAQPDEVDAPAYCPACFEHAEAVPSPSRIAAAPQLPHLPAVRVQDEARVMAVKPHPGSSTGKAETSPADRGGRYSSRHLGRWGRGCPFFTIEHIRARKLQVHQASARDAGVAPLGHRWRTDSENVRHGSSTTEAIDYSGRVNVLVHATY